MQDDTYNTNGAAAPQKKELGAKMSKLLINKAAVFEEELLKGFKAVDTYEKTVTFFGSARFTPENEYYKMAQDAAGRICSEGYTVITGGGGGIMEAGNRGSKEACDSAVGFNIELPIEQMVNEYVTHSVDFSFFASRKMAMYFSGEAYLFFPGGYGTLDEFFQILTLIQTHKTQCAPIICMGSSYWNNVKQLIVDTLLEENHTISANDIHLFTITDDIDEVVSIIKKFECIS